MQNYNTKLSFSHISVELPNAEEIHDHITGMLDGKLGQLAREIAEETASNLNFDMELELFIFLQLNYFFFSTQNTSQIILLIKKVKKYNFFLNIRL